ncbi:hypothetical protein [Streptomyces sp. NPDC047000]|uniref:hypothetical protein n=1 Tax=Streptomyces sp. NPDC047000 TaxID=3155474 RepID=UPI0033D3B6C9
MTALIALLLGTFILAGAVRDTVRLVSPRTVRPARTSRAARERGARAELEDTEQRWTAQLLGGRISPAEYRSRMSRLAHSEHGRPSGN